MNKEVKQIKPMICPVCGEFYFSELADDDIKNNVSPNSIQCRMCGWYYDLEQTKNPELKNQSNALSLNEYIKQYKDILEKNPKYTYYEENCPPPKPHKCPVCGEYTFKDFWSLDICPVCGWQDDEYYKAGGANEISLEDYIKAFNDLRKIDPKYKWINDIKQSDSK